MFKMTNNLNNSNELSSSAPIQAVIINQSFVNNQHLINNHPKNTPSCSSPTCIVIGCKNGNGNSNPEIKYYQLPDLNTNNMAKQWYINTLREDLLDYLLANQTNLQQIQKQHFVCIEHFDEESFMISTNYKIDSKQQTVYLKEDAVPSLFEIEVFQKMIAHQEQISLNQQNQQQKQKQVIQFSNADLPVIKKPQPSLLSSLILSEQPTVLSSLTSSNLAKSSKNNQSSNSMNNSNKRSRIDPDIRAALMQRVPKAVKRTALYPNKHINQLTDENLSKSSQLINKFPKALKQITPRNIQESNTINETVRPLTLNQSVKTTLSQESNNNINNIKCHKAVKQTNPYLKDIPPPIMQSTKRASVNKAIKHTGGAPNSYQSSNNQTLSQSNLNNRVDPLEKASQINQPLSNINNKITITTTYVYKRVSQPLEIDLELECEEEEYIFIKSITPPESPKSLMLPSPNKSEENLNKQNNPLSSSHSESNEKITENQDTFKKQPNNLKTQEIKKESLTETACSSKTKKGHIKNSNKKDLIESESEQNEIKLKNKISKNCQQKELNSNNDINNTSSTKLNQIYLNILSKYYSRRLGSIPAALEQPISSIGSEKTLPPDLKVGNYPAKCNICDLILENNIELTSHICSHLESNNNDSNSLSTYISPFDAVTTTCGVCDSTFSDPFELIKHLDMKHMKQLDEYKCRICEKQHTKLNELITHLSQVHSHNEMPYKCDACGFSTSFYADAIYHIKQEHTSTLRHFCPYCLKSLVLPYNQKLGFVQCNSFYSHLITHFNKQENDILLASKCKHCTKCILHVRHMKDHLINDHSNGLKTNNFKLKNNDKKQNNKRKRSLKDDEDDYEEDFNEYFDDTDNDFSSINDELVEEDNQNNKNKNKSKLKFQENEYEQDSNNSFDVYDFEKQNINLNNKSINIHTSSKIKRRRSSFTNKKLTTASIPSLDISDSNTTCSIPTSKRQKALKQTNIKKNNPTPRRYRSVRVNGDSPKESNEESESQIVTTTLVGNIKFSCMRSMFKCAECGESDIKCHFRNEYTCHQCFYNTNCSRSFEFHLHGHLVSKRVALWNKRLENNVCETYKCPCGFRIVSNKENNSIDTGNKVAEHLIQCEFKFCNYSRIEQNID